MLRPFLVLLGGLLLGSMVPPSPDTVELSYTVDGQMKFPEHYRQWIYLTSGLGMSYTPGAVPEHPMFDNVFVNPTAYKEFLKTGTWPDKTVMVLELRASETKASIDQRGSSQAPKVTGVEVHVR